ncbi:carbohydrate kinase family protein [Haliovirga abyssi]|uniref:Fructokinase n=1 Tax=Haliovirga abyssi TaxID=2996794 RepID=A0AAU9DSW3_9FUSO|nr:carbohydrate kinase [Haliovirga abyssi]BDU50169.1 fructokinase [Haliovirga abyssi]
MFKVACIGEMLIDFICSDIDVDLENGENFTKKAGGAPANVAIAISKLGGESFFIGKVGDDPFGKFLINKIKKNGVDISLVSIDKKNRTTLAFVSLQKNGERDFIFNRGADENLKFSDINLENLKDAGIIHFGSATALLGGKLKKSYDSTLKYVKENGNFISFDPNYRVDLWKDRIEEFIEKSIEYVKYSDFVKVSEEELFLLTKKTKKEEAVKKLHYLGAKIVAVTLGKNGTLISNGKESKIVSSIKVKSIDSTGAGDAFIGAVLYKISKLEKIEEINNMETLEEIVNFGNKVGAITCTKYGAMDALPTLEEVEG